MTHLFFTKEAHWMELWDAFLLNSPRGHYNQLSEWLHSYTVYGFDYQLLLLTEDGIIVGGCGIVVPQVLFFKFVIVPAGPIVNASHEDKMDLLLAKVKTFSTTINACSLQINLPLLSDNITSAYSLSSLNPDSFYFSGLPGVPFRYVISVNGFRFVDLSDQQPSKKYHSNTSRNIVKAFKSPLEFAFATTHEDIEKAYQCVERNAVSQGYSVRDFASYRKTLYALVAKNQGQFAVCKLEGIIVGALFLIECGQRYTYISGGIDRSCPDLKIGHFLHQHVIDLSLQKGYKVYDISVGGNAGVLRFKAGFGSKHFPFTGARYWILKPHLFKLFLFFEKYLKPHKAAVALFLSKLKNK